MKQLFFILLFWSCAAHAQHVSQRTIQPTTNDTVAHVVAGALVCMDEGFAKITYTLGDTQFITDIFVVDCNKLDIEQLK